MARYYAPAFIYKYLQNDEGHALSAYASGTIEKNLRDRIENLTDLVKKISADTLFSSISTDEVDDKLPEMFGDLFTYRLGDDRTLEIADSSGNIIAWNGPGVSEQYPIVIGKNDSKPFVSVIRNSLRTYLSVGVKIPSSKLYVIAGELLELSSPISNRFVRKVSISSELSEELKTQVILRIPQSYIPHEGESILPVRDENGKVIAEFSVAEEAKEGEAQSIIDMLKYTTVLFIVAAGLFALLFVLSWTVRRRGAVFILIDLAALWAIRLLWCRIKFPNDFIEGSLFSPNLYASPSLYGMLSSMGDLSLTVITVAVSALILYRYFTGKKIELITNSIYAKSGKPGSLFSVSALLLLIIWLYRGFEEAVRSFVFDSTVRYENPAEIFISGDALLMHALILLLAISLICVSVAAIRIIVSLAGKYFKTELQILLVLAAASAICLSVFALIDGTKGISIINSIIFILAGIVLAGFIKKWERNLPDPLSIGQRTAVSIILASFIISAPVLHQKLISKEKNEVEVMARDMLRTSDTWLNYVVLDGLHTASHRLRNEYEKADSDLIKNKNIAFILWAETLLGREGYNSALLFYDEKGNEVDRFVVGINRIELREILQQMFDGEENMVHVSEQYKTKSLMKSYGAWITVQDSERRIIGSIALVLSEHQKNLFYENENDLLQQYSTRPETGDNREIAVHELRNDTLIFSSGRKLVPGKSEFAGIENEMSAKKENVMWKEIGMNGHCTRTFFIRNASASGNILAVSIEELDIRWDIFAYMKILLIHIILITCITVGIFLWRYVKGQKPVIGFRGKLFFGFALIVFMSLLILSYYNRQLVDERVQNQLEAELERQLLQLQDRISANVLDEEDFINGINDDYCEALTSENGIDFSVYRNGIIKASSKPELYRARLLDERLNGPAYAAIMLSGKTYAIEKEKTGSIEYIVGYAPLVLDGKTAGIIAIPTINRQKEIEYELAQRNAYVFGAYAVVFGLALVGGGILTLRFARPLRQLTLAAKKISEGDMDVQVGAGSNDEIGTLARTFNEMTAGLRKSRYELAKHEREAAWKEMAKQIAHEIRNPLTPIKLSIQHLRQAFKDNAPDREAILGRVTQTVIDQIEALSRISNEFSSFARMPEGKYERINIDDLLREMMNLFREIPGVHFTDSLDAHAATIVADRDQLRGVFINIIRNAIQAMKKEISIAVESSLSGGMIKIRISDTGTGIPEEIRAKIFEPNFSTKSEGMGLGLAIARRVIEDSGGNISCSSTTAEGTTFEIQLPVRV